MRRRDVLLGAGALGAAALLPGRARANVWGRAPGAHEAAVLANVRPARKVLEIFMYGGLSPWESFWVVDEHGRPDDPLYANQQWHLWAERHRSVFGARCRVPEDQWLADFDLDAMGRQVRLGPLTQPLKDRPDILERMRVMAMRHDLEPHETAIPFALSGFRLGNPRMCGMAAHMQRYMQELNGWRPVPYSFVFQPQNTVSTDNTRAVESVGQHPASARPLTFRVGSDDGVTRMLSRNMYGNRRGAVDAYLAHRAQVQRARYTHDGMPLRTHALDDHTFATRTLSRADELREVLGDGFLTPLEAASCQSQRLSSTATSLEAAVSLLTHPTSPAAYACVVDTGLEVADGGGGYDTHFEHLQSQTRNATHVLRELAARINEPRESDPTKLDLSDTLILLTTEFGRTPTRQQGGRGTNHFPFGYTQTMIGGPIGPDQAGVLGAIGPDGWAEEYITPAEFRAAALVGMGLWPFSHEGYAVGDLRVSGTETQGLEWLAQHVLGRSA